MNDIGIIKKNIYFKKSYPVIINQKLQIYIIRLLVFFKRYNHTVRKALNKKLILIYKLFR
ncbi:hypothetical protein DTU21_02520 [Salmonella enterica subsp. salamae]|nr:hypothetical protein [Salmonella enterica subsp. salamae]